MTHVQYSAKIPLTIGFTALTLLVGGVGAWSVNTQLSGAIIANGVIVVESKRQVIQHAEGGVVVEIVVRDGDSVAAGDLLIRLDDTLLRSELTIIETQLVELGARRARLEAERDNLSKVDIPPDLSKLASLLDGAAAQLQGQLTHFQARKDTLEKELGQIDELAIQTANQIAGTQSQLDALNAQHVLINDELANQQTLLAKQLVPAQRVSGLQRDAAGLAGDIGKLMSDIAQLHAKIASLKIEKLKLKSARREQAISTLRDIQFRALELAQKRIKLKSRLEDLDIRALTSGVIYDSTVFALKSVIRPAEPIMYIVPQDTPLVVSTRVEALHIDQVHVGQTANLRFTAFNQRLTPEIEGKVTLVSADVFQDDGTGSNYYQVDLVPFQNDLDNLKNVILLPGMPVEAYLRTTQRTPISYLTKPMTDYFRRAFREG